MPLRNLDVEQNLDTPLKPRHAFEILDVEPNWGSLATSRIQKRVKASKACQGSVSRQGFESMSRFQKRYDSFSTVFSRHVLQFVVEMRSCNVEVLVSDFMEDSVLICQLEIYILVFCYLLLLSNFFIRVHDGAWH